MDRRLLVLALGMFALGTDSFVVAGVLPEISHAYAVSIGAAGQMTTVYAVTYAVLAPTIAALAASVSRKRLLLAGLGIFVGANLATATAPTLGLALTARAFAGLGAAMFAPTASGAAATLVAPGRRGFALAIIVAGLTAATALGSPIGTLIGGLGDWRWTMGFVAALGLAAGLGVGVFLSDIPMPAPISLAQRLAPPADARIVLILLTTLLSMAGQFTVYTYFSVVFDRAVAGNPALLSIMLVVWGGAGTFANLTAGRLIDRIGTHKVLVTMLAALVVDIGLLPWTGANIWTALPAVLLWGGCGWCILVPQQHRLVALAPSIAPVVLGLNTASTYFGVSCAGLIGTAGIGTFGAHELGLLAARLIAVALGVSGLATRRIAAGARVRPQMKALLSV